MGLDMYAYVANRAGQQGEFYDGAQFDKETGDYVNPKVSKLTWLGYCAFFTFIVAVLGFVKLFAGIGFASHVCVLIKSHGCVTSLIDLHVDDGIHA